MSDFSVKCFILKEKIMFISQLIKSNHHILSKTEWMPMDYLFLHLIVAPLLVAEICTNRYYIKNDINSKNTFANLISAT
jgi:hypothetical protein